MCRKCLCHKNTNTIIKHKALTPLLILVFMGKFMHMAEVPLQQEFEYYISHQAELVEKYSGKYIVIKNRKVIGVYDSEDMAVTETSKSETLGTFLVQLCEAGKDNYTQTFHSRVAFA